METEVPICLDGKELAELVAGLTEDELLEFMRQVESAAMDWDITRKLAELFNSIALSYFELGVKEGYLVWDVADLEMYDWVKEQARKYTETLETYSPNNQEGNNNG